MTARKTLWALLVVGSVFAALALGPDEVTRQRRDIRNPVRVTCEPVESYGDVRCHSNHVANRERTTVFYAEKNIRHQAKCLVVMSVKPNTLPNECQEMPNLPNFSRCSTTIPRSFLASVDCWLEGHTGEISAGMVVSRPLFSRFSVDFCKKPCQSYQFRRFSCVVNEDCRLCMEDFQAFFPGVKMEYNYCED